MSSLSSASLPSISLTTVTTVHEKNLQKYDVLCGRGTGPNEYCGNKHFLKLVAKRRKQYISTSSRSEKAQIAKDIIDQVRSLSPPGRFLEKLKTSCKRSYSNSLWIIVKDEKKCLEKAKQALRETWHRKDMENCSGGDDIESSSTTSTASRIKPPLKRKDSTDCEALKDLSNIKPQKQIKKSQQPSSPSSVLESDKVKNVAVDFREEATPCNVVSNASATNGLHSSWSKNPFASKTKFISSTGEKFRLF